MADVILKEKSIAFRTGHIGAYSKGPYPHLSIICDREKESGLDATSSTFGAPTARAV